MELVIPAVPSVNGLARYIVQHPALARLHAGLVDAVAKQVVVVHHHLAPERISDHALIALDVQLDAGQIVLFDSSAVAPELIVDNREEATTERISMGHRRGCRVDGGLGGSDLLMRAKGSCLTLRMPRRQIFGLGQTL